MKINLNENWDFYFDNEKKEKEIVSIPHSVVETPFNAFNEKDYQTVSRYEKTVSIPEEATGKRLILHVGAAAHRATLYVNQAELYTHKCGYTAFDVDITEAVRNSKTPQKAEITIILDSRESLNQPPFGNVIDYMTYGGIYRDVWLDIREQVYIKSTYFYFKRDEMSDEVIKPQASGTLESKIVLGGAVDITSNSTVNITQKVMSENENVVVELSFGAKDGTLAKNGPEGKEIEFSMPLKDIDLWDITNPVQYTVETTVSVGDASADTFVTKTGFRTVEWKPDGFYLNGIKRKIRGLNRHQSYAYVGYAMPDSMQIEDVLILKHELGLNAVRTSHYPQSRSFIEACDKEGLLVFTELPGWQYIGDDEWKNQAVENVKDMVIQYRNHPSIILWGVRINESMDDDELYEKTNRIAKELAPGVFTGGVRFIKKSSLLEDVYTYNDFIYNGKTKGTSAKDEVTSNIDKSYLITEYCGHMFPTKPGDDELHRIEHALRHATVLNSAYGYDDIAGSFGWCMFDYNTHKDFGSGDRICYHGVMDMFRNPKMAAALYKSQSDEEPVLEVGSDMNIGEYPASDLRKVCVFTNLDSVRLFKNGNFIKEFFPDEDHYGNLPHPPVIVDDFIGELLITQEGYSERASNSIKKVLMSILEHGMNSLPFKSYFRMGTLMLFNRMTIKKGYELYSKYVGGWGDKVKIYEYVGIKDGKEVMRVRRSSSEAIHLEIKQGVTNVYETGVSDTAPETVKLVHNDGYDVASVRIRVLNQNGSVETYVNEGIELEASGCIEIIGPTTMILRGGMGGTYVKTKGTGEGSLEIRFRGENVKLNYVVTDK